MSDPHSKAARCAEAEPYIYAPQLIFNQRGTSTVVYFSQVGSMGAEGYCVNVPWSRAGVGDNDYVYAFEKVVLPIGN